jgi:hypothetical protein
MKSIASPTEQRRIVAGLDAMEKRKSRKRKVGIETGIGEGVVKGEL